MPITPEQALPLAELLCTIRPNWNTRGVMARGLYPLEKHPAPLAVIAWAAIRCAQDHENVTPAVIPLNGPHWNLADRPPTPRLTSDHECRQHPGQWAGNCPACRADQIAQADPPWDPNQPTPADPTEAAAQARAAIHDARASKQASPDQLTCGAQLLDGPAGTQNAPLIATCRRPPRHDGEHRDFSATGNRWADPVAVSGAVVTP